MKIFKKSVLLTLFVMKKMCKIIDFLKNFEKVSAFGLDINYMNESNTKFIYFINFFLSQKEQKERNSTAALNLSVFAIESKTFCFVSHS